MPCLAIETATEAWMLHARRARRAMYQEESTATKLCAGKMLPQSFKRRLGETEHFEPLKLQELL